jgi:hypothetical protein
MMTVFLTSVMLVRREGKGWDAEEFLFLSPFTQGNMFFCLYRYNEGE